MPTLTLGDQDGRIVAVAVAYHLGRPGSETDPDTLQRRTTGLDAVGADIEAQAGRAAITLELTPYQLHRLDEALLGLVNELKQFDLAGRRSAVPGLEAAIARHFPQLTADAGGEDSALDLVTHVVLLRRRLAAAVAEASAALERERIEAAAARPAATGPWWRRWLPGRSR